MIGSATAAAANQNALVQAVTTTGAATGTYTIVVSGTAGTTGGYSLQVTLNAALESEANLSGVNDDTLATAQDINGSAIGLATETSRLAVVGSLIGAGGIGEFESGSLPPSISTYSSNGFGRIQVTTPVGSGNSSSYSLLMDSNTDGNYALNEAVYTVDLTVATQATLSFSHINFSDEADTLPASFVGHANGDGVAISADGNTWSTVFNATVADTSWTTSTIDLAAAAASAGMTLGPNFKVKFQQYDNFGITTDGRGYDDISVSTSDKDYFHLSLSAGESVSIAATAQTVASFGLELRNSSDVVLATGVTGSTNLTTFINNFVVPAAGDYYIRVAGSSNVLYTLVATRSSAIDIEPNESLATAQNISGLKGALGAITSSGSGIVYVASAVVPAFTDISTTGTVISFSDIDDGNSSLSIPFTFSLYGTGYTSVFVGTNGLLTFLSAPTSTAAYTNADLTTSPTQATIAAFWDDLHISNSAVEQRGSIRKSSVRLAASS